MVKTRPRRVSVHRSTASPGAVPRSVTPMAPSLIESAFDHPDWFYEIKWDGYRAVAEVRRDGARFYSRHLRPFDGRFLWSEASQESK